MPLAHSDQVPGDENLLHRLWLYTNYDCNLSCSYCVAESFVGAQRNGLTLEQVYQLIEEAVALGMTELFLTGGEPFILHDIFDMLRFGLERMQVTVLSNGILLKGSRLQRLEALPHRRN
jgi:MoaA/NifB/PqqE/SkfB family radical SAM enzyme